jgi:hypothetical protein
VKPARRYPKASEPTPNKMLNSKAKRVMGFSPFQVCSGLNPANGLARQSFQRAGQRTLLHDFVSLTSVNRLYQGRCKTKAAADTDKI